MSVRIKMGVAVSTFMQLQYFNTTGPKLSPYGDPYFGLSEDGEVLYRVPRVVSTICLEIQKNITLI